MNQVNQQTEIQTKKYIKSFPDFEKDKILIENFCKYLRRATDKVKFCAHVKARFKLISSNGLTLNFNMILGSMVTKAFFV